ncbi:hypothetical protein HPP92_011268 [Vanilla planifolia]|uniref:Uncharacterized protein n=1 Tax=Vanilla planifolia TaxID=51239 RepID=A0A835R2H2_VANPL|nr:hypothetical protein HPP92_011268 [Vanilla planifolia]
MVKDGATLISEGNREKQQRNNEEGNDASLGEKPSSLSSSLESDINSEDSDFDYDDYSSSDEKELSAEDNLRVLIEAMNSPINKKLEEERRRRYVPIEEKFNFPKDPENWRRRT